MSNIWYSTPFRTDKNIGRAYNDFCALVPDGDWICIRDPDTMFLLPQSQALIESIVKENSEYDLIGCVTNRLRGEHQCVQTMFFEREMSEHIQVAEKRADLWGNEVVKTMNPVAGMFLLFPKSTWDKHKFIENTIYCDKRFSESILNGGGKLGVAQGLYLFHLYRWNSYNPFFDIKHLL